MTPDERQMISGLFDRIRQQGAVDKDRDADAMIRDTVRQMPDAPYMLVQTALVQDMVLQQSEQRIRELEDQVQQLEAQSRPAPQQGSGSFLGGLFGGGSRPAAPASVPMAGRQQSSGFGSGARPGGPWGSQPQQAMGQPMGQQGAMPMQQQAAGGGFMRTAMATAAGVAGGMLAANAISNMMNTGSAHASPASAGQPAAASNAGENDAGGSYASPGQDDNNDAGGSYESAESDYNDPGSDSGSWDE